MDNKAFLNIVIFDPIGMPIKFKCCAFKFKDTIINNIVKIALFILRIDIVRCKVKNKI